MKMKTKSVYELSGIELDYAVAVAEGGTDLLCDDITWGMTIHGRLRVFSNKWAPSMRFTPSESWEDAGPIIQRERINLDAAWFGGKDDGWSAKSSPILPWVMGNTPMEAAMRAYALKKLGNEIEIPENLQ